MSPALVSIAADFDHRGVKTIGLGFRSVGDQEARFKDIEIFRKGNSNAWNRINDLRHDTLGGTGIRR